MDFKGKTVFITGAAVGIGRAVAIKFAMGGANLVLADIDEASLASVKAEAEVYTQNVLTFNCDVSNEERVYDVVKNAESVFGKIDILINKETTMSRVNIFLTLSIIGL